MNHRARIHPVLTAVLVLSMLFSPLTPLVQAQEGNPIWLPWVGKGTTANQLAPTDILFRTQVTMTSPSQWTRLAELGVTVLQQTESGAVVLADYEQMTTLARLRFHPRNTEELGALVTAGAQDRPWVARSLRPLTAQAEQVRAEIGSPLALLTAEETVQPRGVDALSTLRSAVQALTPETRAAVASLPTVDDDGDGLTNTEEAWWCTDAQNADTDGDGASDGDEVQAAKDWLGNRRAGPPSTGRPFAGWPPTQFDPTKPPTCRDGDDDGVPDMAERWDLGLNMNEESTDRDKFDDAQELFGTTEWGRGALPRVTDDAGYIFAEMPTWVKAPGNHPFVAAFPVPEIDIVPSSLKVETVTTVTTDHVISEGTEKSYSTAKTEGTSTSNSETETWNDWQEVSKTREDSTTRSLDIDPRFNWESAKNYVTEKAEYFWNEGGKCLKSINSDGEGVCGRTVQLLDEDLVSGAQYIATAGVSALVHTTAAIPDMVQEATDPNRCPGNALNRVECFLKAYGVRISSEYDTRLAYQEEKAQNANGLATGTSYINSDGQIGIQSYYPIGFPSRFVPTTTETSGRSWGGERSTTHTAYEEQTVTNGEAFSNGESWGTATAVDSAHTADLWFTYKVRNTGTEYARQIGNLAFNLYIGDAPDPAYTYFVAPDLGGDGIFQNFMPTEEHTYTSRRIPLSLEQMKTIDLGGALRIVVEDFTYGVDELFYQQAANAGVLIALEDGTDDGDERIDSYLLPTWGDESVVDVLARYFPHTLDENGTVIAIWTPEYRSDTASWCAEPQVVGVGGQRTLWCKHALSTADWWNVYTNGLGDGSEGFQDTPAAPGAVALFRFNKDSDLDGYSDRSEDRLGTDPNDAGDFPRPELLAGLHSIRNGSYVTATLSLLNTGLYDAYGVEAVMIAPDDSVSITNNTVGGSGRVRAQKQVIVGSRIAVQTPLPTAWTQAGHAVPAAGGYYTGAEDRTYTFAVSCADGGGCAVGSGAWMVNWADSKGITGTLSYGAGYAAPTFLSVGAFGLTLALHSGTVANGESFTVDARTPRDTFQYTINREPYSEPLIIVSYNDPQGNHRFIVPPSTAALTTPSDNLAPFGGEMLEDVGVEIVTTEEYTGGATSTRLLVNNPSETQVTGAHVFLEFINISGTVVSEVSTQVTLPPGPTTVEINWDSAAFDPAYSANEDYIVMAFLTDYEGNILDTTGRPLSSFQVDPRPAADSDAANWDFGTVTQGEVLKRTVSLASVGEIGLLGSVGDAPGLSVSQLGSHPLNLGDLTTYELTLDTRVLPVGNYNETVTLRTSDPLHPTYTLQVTGVIEPLTGDAYARPVVDRPLDVEVWVAGEHTAGEWITFTHTLGPDAQNLHPVKVYDTNSALQGVGAVATDLSEGTASADMFGNGADGDITISSEVTFNSPRTSLGATVNAGATSVILGNTSGFNKGDELLIIQVQGVGAGNYEFRRISTVSGNTLTLNKALAQTYTQEGNSKAQIMRVPNYQNVIITSSGRWRAPAWDGNTGGVLVIKANNQVVIEQGGIVDATGKGFMGGPSVNIQQIAHTGEGIAGIGTWQNAANMNGGGGGPQQCEGGPGGGGGGFGTAGSPGQYGLGSGSPGMGGIPVGSADMSYLHFGGGGGGGARSFSNPGGTGGRGGGIIFIGAHSFTLTGMVNNHGDSGANGIAGSQPPENQWGYPGGGGGGAGGATLIKVATADISNLQPISFGGSGGASSGSGGVVSWCGPGHAQSGAGGSGGQGRIRIEYCDTLNGSVNPLASIQKTTCHIAEQTAPATGRLNLPKPTAEQRDYRIQYGYKLDFTAAGEMTATLRVPSGEWTGTSLEALVSGVGSADVDFKLDVGGDGWDWEETKSIDNGGSFITNTLAAAFANYVSSAIGEIDVPIKVYISKPGQLLLTNMVIQRNESVDVTPNFALSGTPTEGAVVPLNVTLTNNGAADSGPLTVAFYATRNSQSAIPTYIGSGFVPSVSKDSPRQLTFNWNTLGFTGPVTVTAGVDPYNRLAETDESNNTKTSNVTILTRPDLALTEVTLSDKEPLVGETVQVTAKLANSGQTVAPAHALTLYRDNPDGGGVMLQSQAVSTLSANGQRNVIFTWTPTTPGLHRLFLRSDRADQVNESDEGNNDHWLDVYVGMASPLAVDSGTAADTGYSPSQGFGVVDSGDPDEIGSCGEAAYQTFRRDPSGRVTYRFNHLQPGHFYHLDLVLYECGQNAGRQQRVSVDGFEIAGPVDLGSGEVETLSLLLDPALYADRSIEVTVSVDGTGGAIVNQIALVDVDYRYADAGSLDDVRYPSGSRPYGWLDGVRQIPWGTLPYQSLRENQSGSELRYRFDSLAADKEYQVHFGFYQGSGNNRVQQIWVDDIPLTGDFTLVAGQRNTQRIKLPKESYSDGTVTVAVRRSDGATTGAILNEIALEEITLGQAMNCQVATTPSFTIAYNTVTVSGQPAPAGTVVTAENPRGDVVGCFVVNNAGQYGFMNIYGEDTSSNPAIPGMRSGEPVIFRINGVMAVPSPLLIWQNDKKQNRVNLAAGVTEDHYLLLRPGWNLLSTRLSPPVPLIDIVFQSIAGKYCLVLGQRGIHDCTVPANFRSLKDIAPGQAYYTKIDGGASVNLVIEGVPLTAETPITLEKGLNWVGYLPKVKLPIATALQSAQGEVIQVADGQGRIYDPAEPGFSTLSEMTPGAGYLVHTNAAASLLYPSTGMADVGEIGTVDDVADVESVHCGGVEPTPHFTAIYGWLRVNGVDVAAGDRVEAVTPGGDVAGCFTVTTAGQYGFMPLFGAVDGDDTLPGLKAGDLIQLRLNGAPILTDEPMTWADDKSTHRLDLYIDDADEATSGTRIYLPSLNR